MAQQLLDSPQVRAARKQVRGEAMPKGVDLRLHSRFCAYLAETFPDTLTRDPPPLLIQKHKIGLTVLLEERASLRQVAHHPRQRLFPKGYETLFSALAKHSQQFLLEIELLEGEPRCFGNS